jgi:hypothetical protein
MSENNARLERDLYDHEHDEPRSTGGRRRRPVADWGVGDDVFEHMPRNRFSRAADGPPRERRFAPRAETAERRPAAEADVDDRAEAEGRDRPEADGRDRAEVDGRNRRAEAEARDRAEDDGRDRADGRTEIDGPDAERRPPAGGVPRGRVDDGRRTIRIGRPEDVPSEIAAITADRDIDDEPIPEPHPAADAEAPPAPGERRTIRIGGRPEGSLEATRAQRRRPPRTAHERVGARPDRLAAWAVALGVLLILIAILSTAL